ncbi:hypothetical protein MPF_0394 [Methanohalophilus portucalensis FDF-1]|uniref:Uncharacterized protein n=1 Tax=Methanohalophilus portucalensis FDF-1 TaxID=523843 RepID=A0A1L9C580_9EURY|nr:hypothetical protein MPF_0394 [Methanohalophilus portucalensis FDF-1]
MSAIIIEMGIFFDPDCIVKKFADTHPANRTAQCPAY